MSKVPTVAMTEATARRLDTNTAQTLRKGVARVLTLGNQLNLTSCTVGEELYMTTEMMIRQ